MLNVSLINLHMTPATAARPAHLSVREMHASTPWIKAQTAKGKTIIVTDRNRPAFKIVPVSTEDDEESGWTDIVFENGPTMEEFAAYIKESLKK